MRLDRSAMAALGMLLAFCTLSVWHLDRLPLINEGEPLILSLGFTLFERGVFGTEFYTGFSGMDQHFMLITPLMSILQGINAHLFGLGVLQMRLVPVAVGACVLLLTFAAASRIADRQVGLAAMALLLLWQWTPRGASAMLPTGIPLLDVSRIARHDILVAPLGLAAWLCFLRARDTRRLRDNAACGLCIGLAGLAHLYGLFWLPTLLVVLALDRTLSTRDRVRRFAAMLAGTAVVWVLPLLYVWIHFDDFALQTIPTRPRFDLLNPRFYVDNVLAEVHRYHLGLRDPQNRLRPGLWVLILGAPAAVFTLARRFIRDRDQRSAALLVPCLVLPSLLAVLIVPKMFNYLILVVPVFAIAVAWLTVTAWRSSSFLRRAVVACALGLTIGEAVLSISRAHLDARRMMPPERVFAEMRRVIPPGAKVMAHRAYWLGLTHTEFRSFFLPFLLSSPHLTEAPLAFEDALERIAPQFVVMDGVMIREFSDGSAVFPSIREGFWAFMRRSNARVVSTSPDMAGSSLLIYRLERP